MLSRIVFKENIATIGYIELAMGDDGYTVRGYVNSEYKPELTRTVPTRRKAFDELHHIRDVIYRYKELAG